MQKSAPSLLRVGTMVGFALSCFGLLLFLWVTFGGAIPLLPKGYRVNAGFTGATALAVEADVRISGVPVGKVKSIRADQTTGRSDVVMEIRSRYAPLPSDVKAQLRQKTLLGETYVELTPGSASAKKLAEEGRIPEANVAPSVQLDEIFRAFDPRTRAAFQTWMAEQARGIQGHGKDVNDALGNLGPFAEDAANIVSILDRQEAAVTQLISNTGVVFEALTERDGQLRDMVTNLETVFRTTGERDQQLQEAFIALPTFQRESRATLLRLDRFARNADPLVSQLRPAARQLSPTLQDLERLAPDLKALFRDLDPLITASKTGFPAAQRLLDDLKPVLQQLDPALTQVIPILQYIKPYKRELTAFFGNTVGATQATDVIPGTDIQQHYLRTTNPVNAENLAAYPRRVGSNRPLPYALPGAFDKLKDGLEVFEDRQCGRGVPVISQIADPVLALVLPQDVREDLNNIFLPATQNTQQPAPACKKQAPQTFQGETLMFPHVKPQP
jgi:virulence factor Mce-like protein